MNDKVVGLVLSESEYRENDSLYQVITADRGFLTIVGKGIRKAGHRLSISVHDLYEFIIDFQDNKTMYVCKGSKLLKRFNDYTDIELISLRNITVEAIAKSRETYDPEMFETILKTFELTKNAHDYLPSALCFAYLLKKHGVNPFVDGCVVCGCTKVVSLSSGQGGFLCLDHLGGHDVLSVATLKKFRLINKAEFKDYGLIKDIETDITDLKLLVRFFEDNTDIHLRSFEFLMKFI